MDIKQLISSIQLNCDISDARYAGNYTLCVYLLKMREYYRWHKQLAFSDKLSKEDIGLWITARESLWQSLEEYTLQPIEINGQTYDPYESSAINQQLKTDNLIYSSGYGIKNKPLFFLAELEKAHSINGYQIYLSGKEFARDLSAPPAMSQNKSIFIRRESFKRFIWERTEEWRWNKPDNAMAKAIQCYDFDNNTETALSEMTENELNAAILHEIGEIKAGQQLTGWHQMMTDISFTQAEIMARAVRDHYADAIHTLPRLIETDNHASIHFYFANLNNMRKHIFPSLMQTYHQWCESNDLSAIIATVSSAADHWYSIAREMIELHQQDSECCNVKIEALVSNNHI